MISVGDGEVPSIYDILERSHFVVTGKKVPILKIHRKCDLFRAVEKHLVGLEATQCSQDFTVSMVCSLAGQRDEDSMFANGVVPPPLTLCQIASGQHYSSFL